MPEGEEVLEQDANVQEQEAVETAEPVVEEAAPVEEKVERPAWTMPVAKAQEEKRNAVEKAKAEAKAEAEAEIQRLKAEYEQRLASAAPKDDYAKELDRVSQEYGLDPKAAAGLLEVMEKKLRASLPDTSKYDEIVKEKEMEGHKLQVSTEFDEKVLPLIQKDYPNATPQHIADVKARVSELAFSKGYNTYRLEDIYRVKQDDFAFKNGFSAEASGGRSSELTDFSKMTDEEEHALAESDPASYAKYLKAMVKKDSRYLD